MAFKSASLLLICRPSLMTVLLEVCCYLPFIPLLAHLPMTSWPAFSLPVGIQREWICSKSIFSSELFVIPSSEPSAIPSKAFPVDRRFLDPDFGVVARDPPPPYNSSSSAPLSVCSTRLNCPTFTSTRTITRSCAPRRKGLTFRRKAQAKRAKMYGREHPVKE